MDSENSDLFSKHMPTGWKRLKELTDQEFTSSVVGESLMTLALMEEMYKAIDRVCRQLETSNLISQGAANQLLRANKKFKEWR